MTPIHQYYPTPPLPYPHQLQLQPMTEPPYHPLPLPTAPIAILYIDNSNIFIEAQKYSARKFKFLHDDIQDERRRIQFGKLKDLACQGKVILSANWYGSMPHTADKIWESIRKQEISTQIFKRGYNNNEKEVDVALSTDATEDLILGAIRGWHRRTFILFTGDKDMRHLVWKALEWQWKVEIWAFQHNISQAYESDFKDHPQVKIRYINEIFEEVTFLEREWKSLVPQSRSFVLEFDCGKMPLTKLQSKESVETIIDIATDVIKLPTRGRFIRRKDSPPRAAYFVVVVSCSETYDDRKTKCRKFSYDFNKKVWAETPYIRQRLLDKKFPCKRVKTAVEFFQTVTEDSLFRQNYYVNKAPEGQEYEDHHWEAAQQKNNNLFTTVTGSNGNCSSAKKQAEPCRHHFSCPRGLDCKFKHTSDERDYFASPHGSQVAGRRFYKTMACIHWINRVCNNSAKPFLCPFAHEETEARCLRCRTEGHYTDSCPNPQPPPPSAGDEEDDDDDFFDQEPALLWR